MSLSLRPSNNAIQQVEKLARWAAKYDGWMRPAEYRDKESTKKFGTYEQGLFDDWEETCHCSMKYITPISDLAERQAKRKGVLKNEDWEGWYYNFYCPLRDAFWQEWGMKVDLYKFWQENVQEKSNGENHVSANSGEDG